MKYNKKTLKRKNSLKKRKDGKTARKKVKKGGRDFGISTRLGYQPVDWNKYNPLALRERDVNGFCSDYGCCLSVSKCEKDEYGKHYFSYIDAYSAIINEPIFVYGDGSTERKTPAYFMRLLDKDKLKYCKTCMRVICDDPKNIPNNVIHQDDATGTKFILL
jgi:hypothetical protein